MCVCVCVRVVWVCACGVCVCVRACVCFTSLAAHKAFWITPTLTCNVKDACPIQRLLQYIMHVRSKQPYSIHPCRPLIKFR